jgi:hypothetical protein
MLTVAAHSPCFLSFNPSLFRSFTHSDIVTRYHWLLTQPASSPLTLHSSDHSLIQTLAHAKVAAHSACFLSLNSSLFRSFTHSDIVTCYQWLPTHPASSPLTLHHSDYSLIQTLWWYHCHMVPMAAHTHCFLSFNSSLFRSFTHSDIVTCYQWLPNHPASSPLTLHSSDHSLIQTLSHATNGCPLTLLPLL